MYKQNLLQQTNGNLLLYKRMNDGHDSKCNLNITSMEFLIIFLSTTYTHSSIANYFPNGRDCLLKLCCMAVWILAFALLMSSQSNLICLKTTCNLKILFFMMHFLKKIYAKATKTCEGYVCMCILLTPYVSDPDNNS